MESGVPTGTPSVPEFPTTIPYKVSHSNVSPTTGTVQVQSLTYVMFVNIGVYDNGLLNLKSRNSIVPILPVASNHVQFLLHTTSTGVRTLYVDRAFASDRIN